MIIATNANAQQNTIQYPDDLKKLSLEELMNIEITSVSKLPEKLSETASAIQVITREEIRRSGATSLPEALRLASNLEIAQIDHTQWAISARGFNGALANKFLVLIDGRTVYSPLFAGVFWDQQDVFLEDIDRIEVISGPGGTLWGANAVNGIINIITLNAKETQGLLLQAGGGTELQGFGGIRYGYSITPNSYLRIYSKYTSRDGAVFHSGQDLNNDWHMNQGGFRLDWTASENNHLTLQGDLYEERIPQKSSSDPFAFGGNVTGRWSHSHSEDVKFIFQFYLDRIHRKIPGLYNDVLNTYDMDFQNQFSVGTHNNLVWGMGYRLIENDFGPGQFIFIPREISLNTFSAFIQDKIDLLKDQLYLTFGTKIEHNDYTGFENQPNIRLAWLQSEQQTFWTAASHAVRTPSRLDRDFIVLPFFAGGDDFKSEQLTAYEFGHRIHLYNKFSLSTALYYHEYNNIRSTEQANPPDPIPVVIGNGHIGESYGIELIADYHFTDWWRLKAGYSALWIDIRAKNGSTDISGGRGEAADSKHHLMLNLSMDLPGHIEFDPQFRYVSRITNPNVEVDGYSELNIRLAWLPTAMWEFSIVGQNLLHGQHGEFGNVSSRQEIERSVYGKILWRF
jgi:iron complex outermembrane receptor protein